MSSEFEPDAVEPATGTPARARSDRAKQKTARTIRLAVLAAGLVIITAIGIAHQRGIPVVGVDALCPFGGIETLWKLVTSATLLQRIAVSSVILLGLVFAMALVFRRAFCGYICPLGAIQELAARLGNVFFRGKRPTIPNALDRPARYLKYVVLTGFTVWTWQAATLVLQPYDPWVAYMHLTSKELIAEFGVGLAVLGVTVAGSIVYDRFFCKYLCPMGALLAAISRASLFKVRRDAEACTSCGACDKACPVNVDVSHAGTITDAECIDCHECVNVCPVKDTLTVSTAGPAEKARTLQPLAVLGIVVAMIALTLGLTTASGSFAWTVPSLAKSAASSSTGTVNPEEIRGSMTFNDISAATGIPAAVFQEHFGVKPEEMDTMIKDLAGTYGFDVHTDVRQLVAEKMREGAK